MQFFGDTKIDFVGKRKMAFIASALIILIGLVSWVIRSGFDYSIDFTGGLSLELDLSPAEGVNPLTTQELRETLNAEGVTDLEIQDIKGEDSARYFLIRAKQSENKGKEIIRIIKEKFPQYTKNENLIRLQEEVGPRIGEELKGKAILAIFYSMLGIILYIWWRFEFTFGIAAVIALLHDVLITLGIFAFTGKEISLTVVAAILTIVGYSLNDTIVIFDRIREDLKVYRKEGYASIINHSINETISRTIITSLTTFIVVLSLYFFGGTVIHDFAFTLMIGVIVGTYSSIFIASPILVVYFTRKMKQKGIKRGM
ncbi:MAG: protein translocase subunit SecF [Candidatus Cloacimonetes bacterium]|nr:protein translocase subunit SecF [Candidatus Cloacimonadota bacterium]